MLPLVRFAHVGLRPQRANRLLQFRRREVVLTSNGSTVGRIYATAQGTFIEVNGNVEPFGAKRLRSRSR